MLLSVFPCVCVCVCLSACVLVCLHLGTNYLWVPKYFYWSHIRVKSEILDPWINLAGLQGIDTHSVGLTPDWLMIRKWFIYLMCCVQCFPSISGKDKNAHYTVHTLIFTPSPVLSPAPPVSNTLPTSCPPPSPLVSPCPPPPSRPPLTHRADRPPTSRAY